MTLSNRCKAGFDALLLLALAVVYSANPTGLSFHEWAGLGIYVLFIAHVGYNWRWVVNTARRLFYRDCQARTRALYVTDLLLLASFVLVGLSGVMISHKVFKFAVMAFWRPAHTLSSAASVILLALHTGLNGELLLSVLRRPAVRGLTALVLAALLAAGIYGALSSKQQAAAGERPRYQTVIALFERSLSLVSGPPEYVRARQASGGRGPA